MRTASAPVGCARDGWLQPTDCIRRCGAPSVSKSGWNASALRGAVAFKVPAWSEFVEVHWSRWGEAYVTPVEPDLVGVAILSRRRPDLAWFPRLSHHLAGASRGQARGCGPLRQVVSRRVAGRVLLVGDAAGYEDALTGEGVSLAVKQAAAAVDAIANGIPSSYESAWHRVTRNYRLVTRGLVLASVPPRDATPSCPLAHGYPRYLSR